MTSKLHSRRSASLYLFDKWQIECSPETLANHASKGTGPEYHLRMGLAHYEEHALDSWAMSRISRPIRKASEARSSAGLLHHNQAA